MSARFVKLHHAGGDGRPTLINTARIEQVSRGDDNGSIVFFVGEGVDGCIGVRESLEEIAALLNGEPPARPLKAHPDAIGWVQHPELGK